VKDIELKEHLSRLVLEAQVDEIQLARCAVEVADGFLKLWERRERLVLEIATTTDRTGNVLMYETVTGESRSRL
jgi:hypothetical protein